MLSYTSKIIGTMFTFLTEEIQLGTLQHFQKLIDRTMYIDFEVFEMAVMPFPCNGLMLCCVN